MRRIIAGLIIFLILISFAAAAPIINPSVESQPMICRWYYTKWICDITGGSIAGPQGPQGLQGLPGEGNITNFFNFSGSNLTAIADIINIFSEMNQTANMTAGPEGPTGPQGIQGEPGAANMTAGPQGEPGIQGDPGPEGAANMTAGPPGETGPQGIQGEQGIPGPMDNNIAFINGTRAFTANLSMGSHYINYLLSPSLSTDAATKGYVDAVNTSAVAYTDSKFTAWATWNPSPSWTTGTPAALSTSARYIQIGKTVHCSLFFSSSDGNGATKLNFALPVLAKNNEAGYYSFHTGFQSVTPSKTLWVGYIDHPSATPKMYETLMAPWTDGIAGQIGLSFTYEAA